MAKNRPDDGKGDGPSCPSPEIVRFLKKNVISSLLIFHDDRPILCCRTPKLPRRWLVFVSVDLSAPAEHQSHPMWVVLVSVNPSSLAEHQNHWHQVVLVSVSLSAPCWTPNPPNVGGFGVHQPTEQQNHLTSGGSGLCRPTLPCWTAKPPTSGGSGLCQPIHPCWLLVYMFMYLISFNIYYFMHYYSFGIWNTKGY